MVYSDGCAEYSDDGAENLNILGVDRLHGIVFGLQTDTAFFFVVKEAFDRCFASVYKGYNDLAFVGGVLLLYDDIIVVSYADVDHAGAPNTEHEGFFLRAEKVL